MGAQLAQMGMGVADTVMAGRYGSEDLAGVALGSSILWPTMILFMGVIQAVTPTVSQLNGSRSYSEIGEVIRQGIWMALFGGAAIFFILNNVGPVYKLMRVDPTAVAIALPYLSMASYGLPALMVFFCLRFLSDGMGYTRPALIISVTALAIKIPLNYVLIYGKFGLAELGGVGCGVAQAIVMWLQLFLILIVVSRERFAPTNWKSHFSLPQWKHIKPLLIVGLPIGATVFAEMGLFSFTTLMLGQFGSSVVASHNIAMSMNAIFYMPPMALGMAATIRIGCRIGAGETEGAKTTARIAFLATSFLAIVGAMLIFLLREELVSLYTTEEVVRDLSRSLLLFVVFFLYFDATQATFLGTLRGYKDTKVPMFIALISYWLVAFPIQMILGFGWLAEPMGIYGFWIGLASGVGCASICLGVRLIIVSNNKQLIDRLSIAANEKKKSP